MAFNGSFFGTIGNPLRKKPQDSRLFENSDLGGTAGQAQSFAAEQQRKAQQQQADTERARQQAQQVLADQGQQADQAQTRYNQEQQRAIQEQQARIQEASFTQQSTLQNQLIQEQIRSQKFNQDESERQRTDSLQRQNQNAAAQYQQPRQQARNPNLGNSFADNFAPSRGGLEPYQTTNSLGQKLGGLWSYDPKNDQFYNSKASVGSFGDYATKGQGVLSRQQANQIMNAPYGTTYTPASGGFKSTYYGASGILPDNAFFDDNGNHLSGGINQRYVDNGFVGYGGSGGSGFQTPMGGNSNTFQQLQNVQDQGQYYDNWGN